MAHLIQSRSKGQFCSKKGTMARDPNLERIKSHPAVLKLYQARLKGQLHRDGHNYIANCPFHTEKTPSFKIDTRPNSRFLYTCFGGCGGGDIIDFIKRIDRVDAGTAIQTVKKFIGEKETPWDRDREKVEQVFQEVVDDAPKEFSRIPLAKYDDKCCRDLLANKQAMTWLYDCRGIHDETAQELKLGYTQDVGSKGGDVHDKGWIAIPYIEGEEVAYLKYRSIVEKQFCAKPGMKPGLFNSEAIDAFSPVYVTEGEFDAAILVQAGFAAVSLPSARNPKGRPVLLPEWKDQLMEAKQVILAGDTDSVGSEMMDKLWREIPSVKLDWPTGMKDANQTFLEYCKRDVSVFRTLVESLTIVARSRPMPGVSSIQEAMMSSTSTNVADDPQRLRFPWPKVDEMAVIPPGSVVVISATNTGMGKTQMVAQSTLYGAREFDEVILNYQAELSVEQFVNVIASNTLQKDRNHLTKADLQQAAQLLKGVKYYVGRDTTLTTIGPVLDLIEAAVQRLGATIVVLDTFHAVCLNEDDEVKAQANAMQRIKNMTVQYGLKWIIVSQPRKAKSGDRGKRTHVSDNKGSEAITSTADVAMALHRDWIQNKDPLNPPSDVYSPETEVHLQKARFKGDGTSMAKLFFVGKTCTFRELSMDETPQPVLQ